VKKGIPSLKISLLTRYKVMLLLQQHQLVIACTRTPLGVACVYQLQLSLTTVQMREQCAVMTVRMFDIMNT
jgi:hypothetical protein